jgi:hypothetical protein
MLRFFEVKTRVDANLLRKGVSAKQAGDMAVNQGEAAVNRARAFKATKLATQVAAQKIDRKAR